MAVNIMVAARDVRMAVMNVADMIAEEDDEHVCLV